MKPFTKSWWNCMVSQSEAEAKIQFKLGNSNRAGEVIGVHRYCKYRVEQAEKIETNKG